MNSILYVGMDVYKENYTLCCYSFDRDKVEYRQTVPSDYRLILKYLEQVHGKYLEEVEFICGYEAGCLGYSLYHQLTDHGVKCIILAPTTMGITNTNRVKTDRKDAANIARCLAFHTYSAVYVPDGEDNAVKEYLRMRDDQKLALKKIKQQIKGDDLLHVHQPNEKITDAQRKDWDDLGVPCTPFENVKYLYPYRQQKDKLYANTALPVEDLAEQFNGGQAANFIYTFEHDISKVDMLFSNVDDPNYTIESILNYIDYGSEFKGDLSWANFKEVLKEFCSKGSDKKDKSSILIQSWQRFRRLINNSINDDIFVNAKSSKKEQHQVYLSDEIMNINGGEMKVVDIAGLTEQLQCLVFGDIIRSVYSLKHGDFEDERTSKKPIPKRIIIFVDELNKYAPSTSSKNSPLLANLLDITERGRSEGVILFSAEQFRSAIHDRIKGNCGTNIYGRTNAIEVSRPDYKFVPSVYANMMTRLRKGDLIVHHPVFKTLLKIQFPFPSYNQGGSK